MGRGRQAVTIKHVAADAGVSLQTVSRVINNEAGVRPAMKQRVQESIDRLQYVPSIAAQRMSGSRSYLILALNDRDRTLADWRSREGVDWVDQMLLGGMIKAAEFGYRLLLELVDTHSDHIERELRSTIAALRPDGIILTPPHSDNALIIELLAEQEVSFARIGSKADGPGISLTMDEENAAAMATRHLVELDHRRIGFIAGPAEYSLSGSRVAGWQGAMREAGLGTERMLAEGDFSFASGARAADALLSLEHPPTAIIASNDQMALATLERAKNRGLAVPDQLSLISFDNTPIVRFVQPPLTAIDQPIAEITAEAVALIVAHQRRSELPTEVVVIKANLVVRGSTSKPHHL